jgi:hypothetical protein
MPRMPTKDDLQQRDPRASYSIPEFRTNPIPGAIQQLGNAVSDLGGVLSQKERDEARQKAADLREATAEREKAERYGYKSKLLQFEASQTEYLTKRGETVEPGAANFTNTSVAEYDKSAKEFFSTVPEHLKPEYDLHLQELRSRIQGGASKFEKEEGKRFTGNQVDGSLNTLLDRQRQNPASWAEVQKEGEALIDAAPHFSKIERDDKKKAWREQRVETWVKENPGEAQKLIQSKPQPSTGPAFEGGKLSSSYKQRLAQIESGGNPNAHNASGADGLYQIMPGTARDYGVTDTRDAAQNDAFIEKFTDDNAKVLRKTLGREPTAGELYLAHQQGPGGASKLMSNPNELAVNLVGKQAVIQNGGNVGMTAAEFAGKWTSKFGDTKTFQAGAPSSGIGYPMASKGGASAPVETAAASDGFQYQSVPPELEGLPHDKLMSVLGQVETANQKQRIATATARKEQLDLGIETGAVTSADEILNDPDIDDGDKATLLRSFNSRKDEGISASQVLNAVQNGQYLDTTDTGVKKGLNRIFNEAGGAQALVDGTEGAMATTMWAWQKSNVIAEDAKQALQTMTRSPDDGVMVRGLAYLDELQRRNPAAFAASFPEATAKTVQRYNDLNGYVPPEQLASEMRKRNDPEYIKTREPLRKIGESEANKTFDTAAVVALFDDRGWYNPGITSAPSGPKVAGDGAMMAEDFRRLYADAYAETGDSEMAKANAFKMLNRVWSPSALNGGAITRYAPEKYYPVKDGDHAWMTELLEADLKLLGYTQEVEGIPALPMGKGPITTKVRPYSVRAMPMTEAQIFAGKQPQYSVIVTNPETGEPDLVTDKNGKPMMWPASGDTRNMLSKKAADFQKDQSGEVQWQDRLTGIDEQMKADETTGGGKLLPGPDTLQ